MLFFLIFVPWLALLTLGALMFLSRQYRYLSVYIVISSTCGLIGALILSYTSMYLATKLPKFSDFLTIVAVFGGFLGGVAVGGVFGAALGLFAARKLIQRIAWLQPLPAISPLKLYSP